MVQNVVDWNWLNHFSLYDDQRNANYAKRPQEQDQNNELRNYVEVNE